MLALRMLGVVLLVGLNAFFVAAEFALVAMRASRVQQLIEAGDARARIVKELIADLDRVLSGVQVGITIASLGLGFVGESAIAEVFHPLFDWLPGAQGVVAPSQRAGNRAGRAADAELQPASRRRRSRVDQPLRGVT